MDYKNLAIAIIERVGGEGNVNSLCHCITRLRFDLKDVSKADEHALKELDGVIAIINSADQYQVVIGQAVSDVYKEILTNSNISGVSLDPVQMEEKKSIFGRLIDTISGVFTPVLNLLIANGIMKGILVILTTFHLLSSDSGTYQMLSIVGDCFFYFFPIFLGYTAMKKFGGSPFFGMAIGAALVYPSLAGIMAQEPLYVLFQGTILESPIYITFLGIPVILMSYATSVIPIIFASYVAAKVEHLCDRYISVLVKGFLTPFFVLAIVIPFTFIVIGPIAMWVSQLLGEGALWLFNLNSTIFGALYGALIQVCVMFGVHWGFVTLSINSMSVLGYDPITIMGMTSVIAQAGAVVAIIIKAKNKKTKSAGVSSVISAFVGISEPAIYGITLPRRKPFIFACFASGLGGAIMGFAQVKQYGMGAGGIFGFLNIINPDTGIDTSFYLTIVAAIVSFTAAFILVYFLWKPAEKDMIGDKKEEFIAPASGMILPLDEVQDEVFASGAVGEGFAIDLSDGDVVSPYSGVITTCFPTKHAYGIKTIDGKEILIHIGKDTVSLKGEGFKSHVKVGDYVNQGDKLVEVDVDKLKKLNKSVISPIVFTDGTNVSVLKGKQTIHQKEKGIIKIEEVSLN